MGGDWGGRSEGGKEGTSEKTHFNCVHFRVSQSLAFKHCTIIALKGFARLTKYQGTNLRLVPYLNKCSGNSTGKVELHTFTRDSKYPENNKLEDHTDFA